MVEMEMGECERNEYRCLNNESSGSKKQQKRNTVLRVLVANFGEALRVQSPTKPAPATAATAMTAKLARLVFDRPSATAPLSNAVDDPTTDESVEVLVPVRSAEEAERVVPMGVVDVVLCERDIINSGSTTVTILAS